MALHRANLVTNVHATNPAFQERYAALVAAFTSRGASLAVAQQRAMAAIDAQLSKQAAMLAYNDSWLLILLSFLVVIPAVFLLRKPKGRAAAMDMH
jgi:DHA2 family multidrug resistance protein